MNLALANIISLLDLPEYKYLKIILELSDISLDTHYKVVALDSPSLLVAIVGVVQPFIPPASIGSQKTPQTPTQVKVVSMTGEKRLRILDQDKSLVCGYFSIG